MRPDSISLAMKLSPVAHSGPLPFEKCIDKQPQLLIYGIGRGSKHLHNGYYLPTSCRLIPPTFPPEEPVNAEN